MGVEIERKFLVCGDGWKALGQGVQLRQGYLSSVPERTVRVRIEGESAMLTIKGISSGATRSEWEYPIPLADAEAFLNTLCERPLIEKKRYRIPFEGMVWEVDEFFGENAGLVVAEIELAAEDQPFSRPDWIGEEVTHDRHYFNSSLIRNPYSTW
ncbi:CYTH domain-containing protein [Noviherbaspirillum denitrificans]|uniref:Adenylate cyclase n=1 Tax=Noviherbaspirillum denitrificans TaxID=1968433 RepID=A0A254T688_9BURK|nr:CYTH domain-containing protein [Noviherbaspirillum denitrificans]OWW18170.1 adenylate cyclase [Noviherbaspirillum denitrificans]